MKQMKKLSLVCLLAISSGAQAWTAGSDGTATFSGQITGQAPVGWEVLLGDGALGTINMNQFNKMGNQHVYKGKAPTAGTLFQVRMKAAGKISQLYDQLTIQYLDVYGDPVTLQPNTANTWDGTFKLQLPAVSSAQTGTPMTLVLPLKTDSVFRLKTDDGTKYADLGSASFAGTDAMFDGMACPTDKTCWLGQQTIGSKDPTLKRYVDTLLPKDSATEVTLANPINKYVELAFAKIGVNAKDADNIAGHLTDFKVGSSKLAGAASLLIDTSKEFIMTADTADAAKLSGDWSAALTVQVTNL